MFCFIKTVLGSVASIGLKHKMFVCEPYYIAKNLKDSKAEYKVNRTACVFRFADIGNHDIMIIYAENGKVR